MKGYEERIEKYKRKLNNQFSLLEKEKMVARYSSYIQKIFPIEEKVKEILDKENIKIGNQRLFYYAYARELFKLLNNYQGKTLKRELAILLDKWQKRKLKKRILLLIKNKLSRQ